MFTLNNISNVWGQAKQQLASFLNNLIISKNDIVLNVNDFIENYTYDGYVCRASVPITGVTSDYFPFVSFSAEAIKTGLFNNGVVETYDGGVYIYATEFPSEDVIITHIKCIA